MADFTKEEVLALADLVEGPLALTKGDLWEIATALRALAKSMDAEPVGFVSPLARAELAAGRDGFIFPTAHHTFIIPLYAAPPVGVPAEPVAVKALKAEYARLLDALMDIEGARSRYGASGFPVDLYPDAAGWMEKRARQAIEGRSALAKQPAPVAEAEVAVPVGARETGWLIESGAESYWTGRSTIDFGPLDHACRFSRRDDAERVRCWLIADANKDLSKATRASEHIWISAAQPPASQNGEDR